LTIPGLKGKRSRDQYKKLVSQYIDAIPVEYSPGVKAELVPLMMEEDRLKMQATMQPEESALKRSTELKRQKVTQDLDAVIAREEGMTPEEIEPTEITPSVEEGSKVMKREEYTDLVQVQEGIRKTEERILGLKGEIEKREKVPEESEYVAFGEVYKTKEDLVDALEEAGPMDHQSFLDNDVRGVSWSEFKEISAKKEGMETVPDQTAATPELKARLKTEKTRLGELQELAETKGKEPPVYKIGDTEYKNKETFLSEVEKLEGEKDTPEITVENDEETFQLVSEMLPEETEVKDDSKAEERVVGRGRRRG
jgi:hypothetical protein